MDKQLEIDFTQWEDWGHATLLMLMYTKYNYAYVAIPPVQSPTGTHARS